MRDWAALVAKETKMTTVVLKGAVAQNYFAAQLVKDYGAELALEKTCGPMHEAVKREITRQCVYCEGTGVDPESFRSAFEMQCPACAVTPNA